MSDSDGAYTLLVRALYPACTEEVDEWVAGVELEHPMVDGQPRVEDWLRLYELQQRIRKLAPMLGPWVWVEEQLAWMRCAPDSSCGAIVEVPSGAKRKLRVMALASGLPGGHGVVRALATDPQEAAAWCDAHLERAGVRLVRWANGPIEPGELQAGMLSMSMRGRLLEA